MWDVREVKIIPLIISATGIIPKALHESIRMLNLPPTMYIAMQRAVVLQTTSIVRSFLEEF